MEQQRKGPSSVRDEEDGPRDVEKAGSAGEGPSLPAPDEALAALRAALEGCGDGETTLLILCDLMARADDADRYRERRHAFIGAIGAQRFSSPTIARVLRSVAVSLPTVRFENRDDIVHAVFDSAGDDDALVLCLAAMRDQPGVVRRLLRSLADRPNPFPTLARLLATPALDVYRDLLRDHLVDAAKTRRQVFHRWARANCADFLLSEVFQPVFEESTDLAGGICKEILTEGGVDERAMLIRRLQAEGTETALRILVLGAYGRAANDEVLIDALASFRHPLAAATLREMVHRANTRDMASQEAHSALRALHEMGEDDGRQFLMEVIRGRVMFLPKFRRDLRELAQRLVARPGEAS